MANVKCNITFPPDFISSVGERRIDGMPVEYTQEDPGRITLQRDNVPTYDGLSVFVVLHGTAHPLDCLMDVFVNDEKINRKPVEAEYIKGGHYVFNFNA